MKRISFYIDKNVLRELKNLPGKHSEHIRRAINEYLAKIQNVSSSLSEREGDKDANTDN